MTIQQAILVLALVITVTSTMGVVAGMLVLRATDDPWYAIMSAAWSAVIINAIGGAAFEVLRRRIE